MVEYEKVKQEGEIAVRKVRITVMRKACYRDLMEKYENPINYLGRARW